MSTNTAVPAPRASTACQTCRERKVKCSGGDPCAGCAAHEKECIYPPSQRRRRKSDARAAGAALERRLARMEGLLHVASADTGDLATVSAPAVDPAASNTRWNVDVQQARSSLPDNRQRSSGNPTGLETNHDGAIVASQSPQLGTSHLPSPLTPSYTVHQAMSTAPFPPTPTDEEEIVLPLEADNCWEHHGPGAWVSICSQPGLKWVCGRTGSLDFIQSAKGLIRGWTARLRFKDDKLRSQGTAEPDEQLAWTYCAAYFEQCYDSVFGVIHRAAFEELLTLHFERRKQGSNDDDPCWFAMRNVIYAAGCRSILARDLSISFVDAQASAWKYFENALSVLRDLLFFPSGLHAVQALTLMTLYAEGLGSPAVEYMLCSSAVRAAQSKGLHRQPSKSWGLPASEVVQRNWLFWAIYCCDKQLALRCGRPSAIDDDNISCEIPTHAPDESTSDIQIFRAFVRHAQICSQISKRIFSVKAFRQSSPDFVASVLDLHTQLVEYRDSLPPEWRPGWPIAASQFPSNSPLLTQIFYLHSAYYGSLIATHVLLTYPWIAARFGTEDDPSFCNQVTLSSMAVAEAARIIIKNTRALEINANTPAVLAFFHPILAHINLFISVLKQTSLATADADVALLDTCAGHFGYLDYATSSEITVPFVKDSAALARNTVQRTRGVRVNGVNAGLSLPSDDLLGGRSQLPETVPSTGVNHYDLSNPANGFFDEMPQFDAVDFDLESRNLFSAMDFNAQGVIGLDLFQIA